MSSQAAVVLAAGQGTRMESRVPKVLHRVCGREMVSLVVDTARAAGLDPTVVVVPPDSAAIQDTLGESVRYAQQPEPLGTGHALLQARGLLEGVDNIAVMNGDVPLVRAETLTSVIQTHLDREASITLMTATPTDPDGLGRVVRDSSGAVTAVVEEADADEQTRGTDEINAGIYCFRSSWLWPSLEALTPSAGGEILLIDLVSAAVGQGMGVESVKAPRPEEAQGVNTRVQLAQAEAALRHRILERWMLAGVTIRDPATVYIDFDAELGEDTVVLSNTHITGASRIGSESEIGPDTTIDVSTIGDRCRVTSSTVRDSTMEDGADVGPFSHIRPGSYLEAGVHVGSNVEVKNSRLGRGTKAAHFSFIGDAEVGANVNIGAGTVTCNYDGVRKHRTVIEDDAFIGSDTMLVAPVTVGARASTGAGAVVTSDVPPDSLAVGVPARVRAKRARDDEP